MGGGSPAVNKALAEEWETEKGRVLSSIFCALHTVRKIVFHLINNHITCSVNALNERYCLRYLSQGTKDTLANLAQCFGHRNHSSAGYHQEDYQVELSALLEEHNLPAQKRFQFNYGNRFSVVKTIISHLDTQLRHHL